MAQFKASVYAPTAIGMPDVAIILADDGRVLAAKAVSSVREGELWIAHMAKGLAEMAERDRKG